MQQMEIYESLFAELQPLLDDHNERVVLEYFNVEAWVQSKLKKTTFENAIRSQYSKTN